jgi:Uma2 family endonuclease
MATAETLPATPSIPAGPSGAAPARTEPPEFPGCKPVHLPRAEIERYEGRLEYWDATIETAWICEPTTSYHERPARLLTRSAERIAVVRGSHIECYGSMDLLLRDERGEPQRIMQADESLYLHPDRARLPAAAMVVSQDDFPDVVLEVDHTTDARRGKLPLYESWGFPEVWVDVPDAPSPSRPRARRPGLTIHLLENGRYRVAAQSRAFPGWTAVEIHAALNEETFSAETSAVLERVGAVLGEREGTGPDDDPLLGSQRRLSHAEGRAEGRTEGRMALARALLAARGIEVSAGFPGVPGFAELPDHAIAEAAAACVSEADFRKRLRSR